MGDQGGEAIVKDCICDGYRPGWAVMDLASRVGP